MWYVCMYASTCMPCNTVVSLMVVCVTVSVTVSVYASLYYRVDIVLIVQVVSHVVMQDEVSCRPSH